MARYLPWIVFTGAVLLSTAASAISLSALGADLPARMEAVAPVAYVRRFRGGAFISEVNSGGYERTPNTVLEPCCWGRRVWAPSTGIA